MSKGNDPVNLMLKSFLLIIVLSLLIQIEVDKELAYSPIDINTEMSPLLVRITHIDWNLTTLYKEYDSLNITLNLTIVYFKVEIEIWNPNIGNYSVEFSDSDEFSLRIEEDLDESNLELTPFWGSAQVITPRSYRPGIISKSHEYPFSLIEPNLARLPNGFYRMDLNAPKPSNSDKNVLTYGFNLTVTDEDQIIEYNSFPYGVTDFQLSYVISQCNCDSYSQWDEGTINMSVENQAMYFEQIFISWCNFEQKNFNIEAYQVGTILIIREVYTYSLITDCLCAYQIKGQLTNLEIGNYSVIFQYPTTSSKLQSRFMTLISVNTPESRTETAITPSWGIFTVTLGLFLTVSYFRKQRRE